MEDISPQSPLTSPPCELEAATYYAGLPSRPRLVARTGTPWQEPTGPEAYSVRKELRPVGNHAIKQVWENKLAFELHSLLESMKVQWTSIDVVRLGLADEPTSPAPVIVWVGVLPASLSGDRGVTVASNCRHLLEQYNIHDVDVEIRESVVTRTAVPKLLTPSKYFYTDCTINVREPLTPALGLPIATPWAEGTGGIFIGEGNKNERLLLLTARHVVFEPGQDNNQHFQYNDSSEPRHEVTLFGQAAFKKYLESIEKDILEKDMMRDYHEGHIEAVEGMDDEKANKYRRDAQKTLWEGDEAIEVLSRFHKNVSTQWGAPESRRLGHVILSPPINVSSEGYTDDWALIEIDKSKINASNFDGNAIDLGTRISFIEFMNMMNPRTKDRIFRTDMYPLDRLLRIKTTIPDEELRNPTVVDRNGEPCLMVLKRGLASGLTTGRANDIFSYVRNYYDDGDVKISKEWAILPRNEQFMSHAFSRREIRVLLLWMAMDALVAFSLAVPVK